MSCDSRARTWPATTRSPSSASTSVTRTPSSSGATSTSWRGTNVPETMAWATRSRGVATMTLTTGGARVASAGDGGLGGARDADGGEQHGGSNDAGERWQQDLLSRDDTARHHHKQEYCGESIAGTDVRSAQARRRRANIEPPRSRELRRRSPYGRTTVHRGCARWRSLGGPPLIRWSIQESRGVARLRRQASAPWRKSATVRLGTFRPCRRGESGGYPRPSKRCAGRQTAAPGRKMLMTQNLEMETPPALAVPTDLGRQRHARYRRRPESIAR